MRIRFKCDQCRTSMYIAAHKRGRAVQCLACGAETRVPSVDAPRKTPILRSTKAPAPNRKRAAAYLAGGLTAFALVLGLGLSWNRPADAKVTLLERQSSAPVAEVKPSRETPLAAPELLPMPTPVQAEPIRMIAVKTEGPPVVGRAEVLLPANVDKVAALLPEDAPAKNDTVIETARPAVPRNAPKLARGLEQVLPLKLPKFKPMDAEDLRRQLMLVPEVGLDANSVGLLERTATGPRIVRQPMELLLQGPRRDLKSLPFRFGFDCLSGFNHAKNLGECSTTIRRAVEFPGGIDQSADLLAKTIQSETLLRRAQSIPALMQMVTPMNEKSRKVLVETLRSIDDDSASEALADLAVFDLSAEVRAAAVNALRSRPRGDFHDRLTRAFRHPWPAAGNHAAQAIVALKMTETLPTLKFMLNLRDPSAPNDADPPMVREVVRVNHLKNCMLCHQRSTQTTDLVRGVVPSWNKPLPVVAYYGQSNPNDNFVRADVVYLRQDFSVVQPVANPGPWPAHQRFDYIVQTRQVAAAEVKERFAVKEYPQRQALRFAIAALTNDPGAQLAARGE